MNTKPPHESKVILEVVIYYGILAITACHVQFATVVAEILWNIWIISMRMSPDLGLHFSTHR